MPSYPKLKAPVRQVISLLAHGDYKALEKLTNGVRLSAAEMAEAVREYGGGLILPPEDSFDNLDVVEVQGAVDLWTAGEGQSDLTLELTLRESGKEVFDVEIDNIHVL